MSFSSLKLLLQDAIFLATRVVTLDKTVHDLLQLTGQLNFAIVDCNLQQSQRIAEVIEKSNFYSYFNLVHSFSARNSCEISC